MEWIFELPDFDGNIDLSTLDSYAADFAEDSALATFGLDRLLLSIGIICVLFGLLYQIFRWCKVGFWIVNLDLILSIGVDFINWS